MRTQKRRLNAIVTNDIYCDLNRIAKENQITMTTVIAHAISLLKWFYDCKRDGNRVMVEKGDRLFEVGNFF